MEERKYIFDKRAMKRNLIKYGVLLLVLIPILLLINYFIRDWNFWGVIGIDVAVGVVVMALLYYLLGIIEKKKKEKIKEETKQEKQEEKKVTDEAPKKENRGIKKYPKKVITKKKVKK